jgi:dimethylaniline monooxygenase (N-oxide forming)
MASEAVQSLSEQDPTKASGKRIAVIGAGAAGLCATKYLRQAGFSDITVFEIGTQIGGLWCYENDNGQSSAYATLHINTPKSITSFSDLPFPEDVQVFPDHRDMHSYLTGYAKHFDLLKHIRFNSRVVDIRPAEPFDVQAPKWRVTTKAGDSQIFDRIIVASGHLSSPMHIPQFQNEFAGEYMHTHYYRSPDKFVGRRVCIIGSGNSACDVAADICMTAASTVMVARSGVIIAPKLVFGVPYHDVKMRLERMWIPRWLRVRIESFLVYALQGSMTELGFKKPDKRVHGTSNAVIVQHIKYRRILVKQGIDRIEGRRIFFSDGTDDEFDVLLAGTGYNVALPFLKDDILPVRNNSVDLYKRIVSPDWPGLYFVGLTNTNTSLMQMFEHQMQWIIPHETGQAMLPSSAEMRADIEARRVALLKSFSNSLRHTLEEPYQEYFPALQKSVKEGVKRMQATSRKKPGASTFANYTRPSAADVSSVASSPGRRVLTHGRAG